MLQYNDGETVSGAAASDAICSPPDAMDLDISFGGGCVPRAGRAPVGPADARGRRPFFTRSYKLAGPGPTVL